MLRDILQRHRGTDYALLQKTVLFLCSHIGSIASPNSIANALSGQGNILVGSGRTKNMAGKTVEKYISMLRNAFVFYSVPRYDVQGKQILGTLGKNYIADMGFRNMLLGFRDADRGAFLENIVFLELLRRGYRVYTGRAKDRQIDFVAEKADDRIYIQVTESMQVPQTRERELRPLRMVKDNYEKIVLSMDRSFIRSDEGIRLLNLADWLLAE